MSHGFVSWWPVGRKRGCISHIYFSWMASVQLPLQASPAPSPGLSSPSPSLRTVHDRQTLGLSRAEFPSSGQKAIPLALGKRPHQARLRHTQIRTCPQSQAPPQPSTDLPTKPDSSTTKHGPAHEARLRHAQARTCPQSQAPPKEKK